MQNDHLFSLITVKQTTAGGQQIRAPGQAKAKGGPAPTLDILFPLQPFHQTPGPVQALQTYLQALVLERWDAEIRCCDEACKAQLLEHFQGPVTHQLLVWEMIAQHWDVEKKRCEEAHKVQILELLLAAHGITSLV
ncbi:hypothetical protein BDR07DRAFT_1374233 [Suillus spraguei]|nr:hypothetical protein BDR07DRAFT_1374233 [Suillus spraguei]